MPKRGSSSAERAGKINHKLHPKLSIFIFQKFQEFQFFVSQKKKKKKKKGSMRERSNQLLRAISGIGLPPETPGNPFAVLPEDVLTGILLRAGRTAAVGLYLSCAGNAGRLAGMRRLWRELGGAGFGDACGSAIG
jgi:hypothetical protein